MATIKRRIIPPRDEDPARYRERMLADYKCKRCVVCHFRWPVDLFVVEDGVEKCPLCADLKTEDYKIRELVKATRRAARNAKIFAKSAKEVSQFPLNEEVFPGTILSITRSDGTRVSQRSPLRLVRGVATPLLLVGSRFVADDHPSSYGSASIVDDTPPVVTDSLITLSINAQVGAQPGDYTMTFNSKNYTNLLQVR